MIVKVFLREGQMEVGTGKPGYRWTTAYFQINPDNGNKFYPPVTRREAYALAKRDGEKALFFDSEDEITKWVEKNC